MKILLTGGSGKLGTELQRLRKYTSPTHQELDLSDEQSVVNYFKDKRFDLIIHAGAYVSSLTPEEKPIEALRCFETNVLGSRYLVQNAKCPIIYISTEGVIDPYNVYCISKLAAENEIKKHPHYSILRTNFWLDPYPYLKACDDLYTIGDRIDAIAGMIDDLIGVDCQNKVLYVGSGPKLVIDIARKTRPDIETVSCEEFGIPNRKELVQIWEKLAS